jgi:hypothetical protein
MLYPVELQGRKDSQQTVFRVAFPMAFGATNIAFVDFVHNRPPRMPFANHAAYIITLFPANVIEVKAAGIGFPAVDTRMQ